MLKTKNNAEAFQLIVKGLPLEQQKIVAEYIDDTIEAAIRDYEEDCNCDECTEELENMDYANAGVYRLN